MEQQGALFNTDTSGVSLTYMWFGQVVDESTWVENHAREDGKHSLRTRDDFQGYGYRYKVRIFGRELDDKTTDKTTKDEELYMAEVSLPVTAGSGHGGSVQTPNLRQGNYVFGFYKDGVEGTEPIIFGLLPNHAQTRLLGGDPESGFVPRTGGNGLGGSKQFGNKNLLGEGPDGGNALSESAGGNYVLDVRDIDVAKEQRTHNLPKTYNCDAKSGGAISQVTRIIKDIQTFLNKIKSTTDSFAGQVSDVLDGVNSLIEDAALFVADIMKGVIGKMRGFAENFLNKTVELITQSLAPPNATSGLNVISELVIDILGCVFNKIIKSLFDSVLGLIKNLANNVLGGIDAATCAATGFMSNLLGGILGPIAEGMNAISGIIGGALSAASGIFSFVFNALDSLLGLLEFLTCDEDLDCSAGDGWSFWYGDAEGSFEVPDFKNAIQQGAFDGGGGGGCNVSPSLAQPPTVKISGGGGIGAIVNAIISPSGEVIGFDVINGGSGYTSSPSVTLSNNGPGSGIVAYGRLSSDKTFLGGIGGDQSRNPDEDPDNTVFNVADREVEVPLKINAESEVIEGDFAPPVGARDSGKGEALLYNNFPITIGGRGGFDVRLAGTGAFDSSINGNQILHDGFPVTSCGRNVVIGGDPAFNAPIQTKFGPLKWKATGGTPVTVGGKGGSELTLVSIVQDLNNCKIFVKLPKPIFDIGGVKIIKGPFEGSFTGQGNYSEGSFSGSGTFTAKDNAENDISLEGDFSGFDKNLKGEGKGTFNGDGVVRNGRFVGEGTFTADAVQFPLDDDTDPDSVDITSNKGERLKINSDGTGSLIGTNGKEKPVLLVKSGASGGKPILAGADPLTFNGNSVTLGGKGGEILKVVKNTKGSPDLLKVDGVSVKVGGYSVSTGSGVPLVVGGNLDNSKLKIGKTPITYSGNNITSAFDVGTESNNITAPGTFSGPDGSPLESVIVLDPGVGYLNKPDGSIYSDGVKISDPDGTIILSPTSGYSFYSPNTDIQVIEGDLAFLPPGTDVRVYDNSGEEVQKLIGEGLETGLVIEETGILTTPVYDPEDIEDPINLPSENDGSYPVLLKLVDVLIANPGINYSPEDQITIEPSNGAILEPVYNNFGKLVAVNIINPGLGFAERPDIFIRSFTGINAIIIPVFGVERVGDLTEIEDQIPEDAKLIEVIDCVGKITRSN